jgi:hypothetical protein
VDDTEKCAEFPHLTLVIIGIAKERNVGKVIDQSEAPGIIGGDFLFNRVVV